MQNLDDPDAAIFVSARSFAEYVKMFSLSTEDLQENILDCAAGAASFTCELNSIGGHATALDPLYSENMKTIERRVMAGVARATNNVRAKPDQYNWNYLSDQEAHYATRLRAAQLFLEDFQREPKAYVSGTLSSLPFVDQAFDIVLCSHLLFTYAGILETDFHVAAISEMLRVCKHEIRIFPIVGFYLNADAELAKVLDFLATLTSRAEIVPVDYHFLNGSGNMLCVTRL